MKREAWESNSRPESSFQSSYAYLSILLYNWSCSHCLRKHLCLCLTKMIKEEVILVLLVEFKSIVVAKMISR